MDETLAGLRFELESLSSPEVRQLITEHLEVMRSQTPPESVHALEIEQLKSPGVELWSVWMGDELVGCGALKRLSATDGEIKSMHVRARFRGRGIAARIVEHIETVARARGLQRLSLETGAQPEFEAARRLYRATGYRECGPFGDYADDPVSTFMTKTL